MKCREIILPNATEDWYIIFYDLCLRLWYIATSRPFCKDATLIIKSKGNIVQYFLSPSISHDTLLVYITE